MLNPANDNDPLRFLSVCSGIEAASVAWHQLGWQCIGVAEIEPFPAFVLAHHYGAGRPQFMPDPMEPGIKTKDMRARKTALKAMSRLPVDTPLPNYGDFTKIEPAKLGRVDILCGGTPCQAFSVAGLRQSLGDARGNLSLEFVRLAHELADGNGLRNVVWENVVGVLSTKDNAFGCFLGGLVGAASAIEPVSRGKWPRFGMVSGPKGRAAWAVKDAQFFGVAQRRRRVLVVADFGNGSDPAEVLFELLGLSGDTPPSREKGKDVAPTISARPTGGGGLGTDFDLDGGVIEVAKPLLSGGNTNNPLDGTIICMAHGQGGAEIAENRSPTLTCNHEAPIAAYTIQAGALRTNPNSGPDGVGVQEGIAYTLEARAEVQAVAFVQNSRDEVRLMNGDGQIVGALAAEPGIKQQTFVAQSAVRRLTPTECERLQGFPDGYTDIPWRGKPTSPDGPRYKALGNSWAVPKFTWLGRRIAMHMPQRMEVDVRNAA